MDEFKADKATYTVGDFLLWRENNILEITPKFQKKISVENARKVVFYRYAFARHDSAASIFSDEAEHREDESNPRSC